jgi:MFS family permease
MKFRLPSFDKDVPVHLRTDFFHLYMDIFWFGVLNGSAMSFIPIYVARIGGTGTHIGLLGALPAIATLIFALPAGTWLQKGNNDKKVVDSSIVYRIFYLLWVPIPLLFIHSVQIELILIITFIMSIPGTVIQVGFNELFAETVPIEWRGLVAGIRNAMFALMAIVISLVCGKILTSVAFPYNYQIVFGIGFGGAMLSSLHIWLLTKRHQPKQKIKNYVLNLEDFREDSPKPVERKNQFPRFDWPIFKENQHFYLVMLLLFAFHIIQYLSIPVLPLFWVKNLHLTDSIISIGNGVFFFTVFLGSTQLSRLTTLYGNKKIIGIGAIIMGFYPGIMAFSKDAAIFYIASLVGGIGWAFVGGILVNYLLEKIPEQNRSPYMAIYYMVFCAAILIGSLGGPWIGNIIGLPIALLSFGILRAVTGVAILWKG